MWCFEGCLRRLEGSVRGEVGTYKKSPMGPAPAITTSCVAAIVAVDSLSCCKSQPVIVAVEKSSDRCDRSRCRRSKPSVSI